MRPDNRQNQAHPEGATGPEANEQGQWPYCAALGNTCLVYEMGQHLGANVSSDLVSFVANAEEGARLILQKNRAGFTAQVTQAVQRGTTEPFGLAELKALRNQLNPARNEREKQ